MIEINQSDNNQDSRKNLSVQIVYLHPGSSLSCCRKRNLITKKCSIIIKRKKQNKADKIRNDSRVILPVAPELSLDGPHKIRL